MKTRTKLYCATGTLAALTGFYLLGAHQTAAQPQQVTQRPAHVSGSQRPAQPAPSPSPSQAPGRANATRCAEAITKAALVIDQVDPGRFDNPYTVCPGTRTEILDQIRSQANELAKLPR